MEEVLSQNLTALRKERGFRSREAFAEAARIPFPTYRDIEGGKTWPEKATLLKIAGALRVPPIQLFQGTTVGGEDARLELFRWILGASPNQLRKVREFLEMRGLLGPNVSAQIAEKIKEPR